MEKNYNNNLMEYRDDIPCIINNNKINRGSLTQLGSLSGAPTDKNSINGASFKVVNYDTPHYEKIVTERVIAPWLAQNQERTFMNRIKEKNQDEVKTYANYKLYPIPDQKYETYEPIINITENTKCNNNKNNSKCNYNMESFNSLDYEGSTSFIFRMFCVFLAILLIYLFFKFN